MMTSVKRPCFTTQHQPYKTKTKTKTDVVALVVVADVVWNWKYFLHAVQHDRPPPPWIRHCLVLRPRPMFLVSDLSCPKTDGLRPNHWTGVSPTLPVGLLIKLLLLLLLSQTLCGNIFCSTARLSFPLVL